MRNYEVNTDSKFPVKSWTRGVTFEEGAQRQVSNVANMPFIHKHIAIMPDVHFGLGATVGSVIPTKGAIIPAAVGVDIGCGMAAVQTSLSASDLPDSLAEIRSLLERKIPHGFMSLNGRYTKGTFVVTPQSVCNRWARLQDRYNALTERHPKVRTKNPAAQLGTLGGGNHFIELCLDEEDRLWVMLHSGSRGIGNVIGRYFIDVAKEDMRVHHINLPDHDLSYLSEGTQHFDEYIEALTWAQEYAAENRKAMMELVLQVLHESLPPFTLERHAINCHHNYASVENHFGSNIWVTRKGAVRAREGDLGIIPGSMGAKSFIVRGLGNPDSFHSCSHGAGRVMSRTQAKKEVTIEQHTEAVKGVECRVDESVIDETPSAYKDIDAVMTAQHDLVDIVHILKQVLCVKG